jgi:pimeloyl-ACP methyl ester carboxylesterase
MALVKSNVITTYNKNMDALKASIFVCAVVMVVLALSGCGAGLSARNGLADKIAHAGGAQNKLSIDVIHAKPFYLTSYAPTPTRHRAGDQPRMGRVYIEGDGLAWVSKTRPSLNPTPIDPYGLRLAMADGYAERVYLARPCQYSGWDSQGLCPTKYWTTHRYAAEVVQAYTDALNQLKAQRGWASIELVGYSGGGAMALLVARGRNDIAAIRSVAGNLDIDAHSRLHEVDLMPYSLNPANYASDLASIPQNHFVGRADLIVPAVIARSYARKAGRSECIQIDEQGGVTHGKGWIDIWPRLLQKPFSC